MRTIALLTAVLLACSVSASGQYLLFDDFDDGVIDPGLWSVSGLPVEHGTLLSLNQGDFVSSINTYEGDLYLGLRNVYDSRNQGDYSAYNLGYAGYSNLLLRNDLGTYAGSLTVMVFVYPNWIPLTSISISDRQYHDVDAAFEWTVDGLLITLDDLGTPGIDVQTLITDPQYIPTGPMQIWDAGNAQSGGTWDLDYVQVVPEPATLALLSLGGLAGVLRRRG